MSPLPSPHPPEAIVPRAFGTAVDDLALDPLDPDRPAALSRVLSACTAAGDRVWSWTIDRRLRALLAALRAADPSPLAWRGRCAACQGEIEFELALEALLATEPGLPAWQWPAPDAVLELRQPTGDDQRRWRAGARLPAGEWPAEIAASLVSRIDGRAPEPGWCMPASWLEAIQDQLARQDPLGALEVSVRCPLCDAAQTVAPDLEALALSALARIRRGLLEDIHRLARAYHWTEAEVLAVPPPRRAWYLARLDREPA